MDIDAVIDPHGNVVRAHAVSGPGLLIPAALAAVDRWKYAPTYLNGEPVSIAMQGDGGILTCTAPREPASRCISL